MSQAISKRGEIYEDPLGDKHSQQERATRHFGFITLHTETDRQTHIHTHAQIYSALTKEKHNQVETFCFISLSLQSRYFHCQQKSYTGINPALS